MMLMPESAESPTTGFGWIQSSDAEFGMGGKFEATLAVCQTHLNRSLPGVSILRRHSRQT